MQSAFDALTKAQNLIRDPDRWTKRVSARDAEGNPCSIDVGFCFCTLGALAKAGWNASAVKYLTQVIPQDSALAVFNDNATHDEVMAMFDRAKELALNVTEL